MKFPLTVVILAVIAAPLCLAKSVDKSNLGTPEENEVLKGRTDPKRCCLPQSCTGKFKQVAGIDRNGAKSVQEQDFTMYQDVPNQRMALNVTGSVGNFPYTVRYVFNYKEGVLHTITHFPGTRSCVKSSGPKNATNCVPQDAEYTGSWSLGGKSASIMVDSWKYTTVDPINHFDVTVHQTVTQDDCTPVTMMVYGGKTSMNYLASQMWHELEDGVKDKTVFDLPDYCE